jgi:phenylalanyl-tRNA synthetase beta chain
VISNNNNALAIAGVKGGTLAEISPETKNIILESANFDPVLIRKTAQKLKIQTDASKRYENDLTPELAGEAMDILTMLILEIASTDDTKVGKVVDVYPVTAPKFTLKISANEVEKILGLRIEEKDIIEIFNRFEFAFKKDGENFMVDIPAERLDLRLKEDLVEEIGRVYGYDKLPDVSITLGQEKGQINKSYYYANKIKKILVGLGLSEIYGYAFTKKGDIELANSVAPEKKFLRNNLSENFQDYLEFNARYSELIDMPQVKIFEIGKVFKVGDEHNNLAIGVKNSSSVKKPKEKETLDLIVSTLSKELNIELKKINKDENIAEFNFDELIAKLPEPKTYDFDMPAVAKEMRFKRIAVYPSIIRDVAVFTPENTTAEDVWKVIGPEVGDLMVKYRLFDTFKKDGKISYAYRLIFQSYEKTLSDEEVNKIMDKITLKLNSQKDWQVR